MNYRAFYNSTFRILLIYLTGLVIFQFFRTAILLSFSSIDQLSDHKLDLLKAFFFTGFKFDTVVLFYLLVIPFTLSVISAFVPERKTGFHQFTAQTIFRLTFILYVLTIILLTCNFYYYKFFQTNFDLLVFGLFNDDTHAVVYSMWTDYPIIKIIIGWLASTIILFFIIRKITRVTLPSKSYRHHLRHGSGMLMVTGLFCLGMRGSLGEFPIEKDDATISVNSFINSITMNGIFSLKDACADYYHYRISPDTASTLSKYGYADKKQVLLDLREHPFVDSCFFDTTPKSAFLESQPPHVIFCLMESMSNYYLDLHSETLNLMGELDNQLNSCIVFRNFTSARNSTIHSLEGLMVSTPITPLSQSSYINKPLASSVAKAFLEKGYETKFITGGKLGWRNIGKYASTQYFRHIEGSAGILKFVPGASACEWGAYDEFVFRRIFDILQKAKKPQFIFVLLTTNHTPYQLPDHYLPFPLQLTDSIKKSLKCDQDIAIKNFTAYQYSNHHLGNFIKNIKSSPISERTIVAAAGDHNTMALFDFPDEKMLMRFGVPFILQIPKEYSPARIDTTRYGSHKDIFPTLFNLALSNTAYFKSGNNLFGADSIHYFSLNEYVHAFDKNGAALLNKSPVYLRRDEGRLVPCSAQENPSGVTLLKHAKGYATLLELEIKKMLSDQLKK